MNFFKTENCPVCGKPVSVFGMTLIPVEGKFICSSCSDAILVKGGVPLLQIDNYSAEELRRIAGKGKPLTNEHRAELDAFQITKQVSGKFCLDEINYKFAIPTEVDIFGKPKNMDIYRYEDIINYELLETGNSVSKGGVGRAVVGGALFGDVGAVVGASTGHKNKSTCSSLKVKITTNDVQNPDLYITLLSKESRKDSPMYNHAMRQAQEIISLLDIICGHRNSATSTAGEPGPKQISGASEIREYKALLDDGIITQEEFDAKKKQILGL